MEAEAAVQSKFATVAVASRDLGIVSVIAPPMIKAMICTASPTDLSYKRLVSAHKGRD
jgi:hypothetical protein